MPSSLRIWDLCRSLRWRWGHHRHWLKALICPYQHVPVHVWNYKVGRNCWLVSSTRWSFRLLPLRGSKFKNQGHPRLALEAVYYRRGTLTPKHHHHPRLDRGRVGCAPACPANRAMLCSHKDQMTTPPKKFLAGRNGRLPCACHRELHDYLVCDVK